MEDWKTPLVLLKTKFEDTVKLNKGFQNGTYGYYATSDNLQKLGKEIAEQLATQVRQKQIPVSDLRRFFLVLGKYRDTFEKGTPAYTVVDKVIMGRIAELMSEMLYKSSAPPVLGGRETLINRERKRRQNVSRRSGHKKVKH